MIYMALNLSKFPLKSFQEFSPFILVALLAWKLPETRAFSSGFFLRKPTNLHNLNAKLLARVASVDGGVAGGQKPKQTLMCQGEQEEEEEEDWEDEE